MRISDWSSDVCSSDLIDPGLRHLAGLIGDHLQIETDADDDPAGATGFAAMLDQNAAELAVVDQQIVRPFQAYVGDAVIFDDLRTRTADRQRQCAEFRRPCRSEERRVGKEGGSQCRSRGWPNHTK